jgi:ATP-dependent DNA ligase I
VAAVQRAFMLRGDLAAVAVAALAEGPAALERFHLEVGRPVRPMLARPAKDVDDALARLGTAAIEWKLDGARVQVHRRDDDVSVYTRSLDDVTTRVPEIVAAARELPIGTAVLDGEAIALRADGRPEPFQVTGARFASRRDQSVPLTLLAFDVLHADGEDVLDRSGAERAELLAELVPEERRIPRRVVSDAGEAGEFLEDTIARGHEGVMLKSLEQPYVAGSRGAGWLKVKPVHTLDLVVLAAEWGHGRRRGWLSNLHLGARDPSSGGFVMLGKTFKGLTDEMLTWQTRRLLELETSRDDWTVYVRPELVVEIAFDGVQRSTRYPGGVTLRFARVLRYREDKAPAEADTLDAVLATRGEG